MKLVRLVGGMLCHPNSLVSFVSSSAPRVAVEPDDLQYKTYTLNPAAGRSQDNTYNIFQNMELNL